MKLAVVGPYATPDGISIYLEDLFLALDESVDVTVLCSRDFVYMSERKHLKHIPCWDKGGNNIDEIIEKVIELNADIVHLQLHESYFQINTTAILIDRLISKGFKVVVTAHNVRAAGYDLGEIRSQLRKVHQIIALSRADRDYLAEFGINVIYQPHPYWQYELVDKQNMRKKLRIDKYFPIIATHGLVNSNKGLLETAKSIALIKKEYPNVLWIALNAVHPGLEMSKITAADLEQQILDLKISENIYWHKSFIDNNETVSQMLSLADVGLLPYTETGESASGAIRKFVAAQLPSVISNIKQLSEVNGIFTVSSSTDSITLAGTIIDLLNDSSVQLLQVEKMRDMLIKHSWKAAADKHMEIYNAIIVQR